MATVTKQTIDAAWRSRGNGGMLIRDDRVKGLVLALQKHHASWRLEFRLPGLTRRLASAGLTMHGR